MQTTFKHFYPLTALVLFGLLVTSVGCGKGGPVDSLNEIAKDKYAQLEKQLKDKAFLPGLRNLLRDLKNDQKALVDKLYEYDIRRGASSININETEQKLVELAKRRKGIEDALDQAGYTTQDGMKTIRIGREELTVNQAFRELKSIELAESLSNKTIENADKRVDGYGKLRQQLEPKLSALGDKIMEVEFLVAELEALEPLIRAGRSLREAGLSEAEVDKLVNIHGTMDDAKSRLRMAQSEANILFGTH